MKERAESENVSPTAFATGHFWFEHGLSHSGLVMPEGKRAARRFGYLIRAIKLVSRVSLDAMMLARHKGIDALLTRDIESGKVTQVIELAAGLSPRGWRFTKKYGDRITYIETDLPRMVALKDELLRKSGIYGPKHRVVTLDALADEGPDSLKAIAGSLDRNAGLAILSEGLFSYLDPESARATWRRIAQALSGFRYGAYFSDLYLQPHRAGVGLAIFRTAIERTVRGRMYTHFGSIEEAQRTLEQSGFASAQLHLTSAIPETRPLARIPGGDRVHILEAHPGG
jgi:O-methyltransferase involved in polyketide biosynthesis